MVDRWSGPLQAITANDYRASRLVWSTGETKTITWWETVVGLVWIQPSQPLILARPFVENVTDLYLSLFCYSTTECVYSQAEAQNILDQSATTNRNSVVCEYQLEFRPFIPSSTRELSNPPAAFNHSPKTKPNAETKGARFKAKFCSQIYLNIPHRTDLYHGLSREQKSVFIYKRPRDWFLSLISQPAQLSKNSWRTI